MKSDLTLVDQNEFVRNYLDSLEPSSDDFIAAKDLATASQPVGDGWVLAGDALGFIDPFTRQALSAKDRRVSR